MSGVFHPAIVAGVKPKKRTALAWALCAAAVVFALPSASAVGVKQAAGSSIEIRRTEYGIPHIVAHNYSDLGYGYGYAFAQDNACEMADRVLTLRGQRSQYFGASAMNNGSLAGSVSNLDSDTYFQALRRSDTVEKVLGEPAPVGPTPQARQIVDGYVAGFNQYLKDVGVAHLPDPTCRGKAWVGAITAADVWTNMLDIDQVNGVSAMRAQVAEAAPPAPGAAPASAGSTPAPPAAPRSGDTGSNGWAIGRAATANHDGMLLINPHLPWTGDARFYQVQLTIPGVLDVTGGSLYGTPVVEIGHTAGVAFTGTTDDATHMMLYQLQLVPGDPTSYLVDGKPEKMRRTDVPVTVLGEDGNPTTVVRTLYTSRYGPMLADGWTTATATTVLDARADDLRSVSEWLAMDRAQDVGQLRAAQQTYQGIPWSYTIATDRAGTAYMADAAVVPRITDAQIDKCDLAAISHVQGPLLDGSTTACAPGSEPGAVEPGLFGPASYPTLTRDDYVVNSNNPMYATNAAALLTGYPGMFGPDQVGPLGLALRPQLGLTMVTGRIAGTDGLGPAGFTLATLQELFTGDQDRSAQLGLSDVLAMCQAHPTLTATDGQSVDTTAACAALGRWDGRANSDSHGEILWSRLWSLLQRQVPHTWWRVAPDPNQLLTTPSGLNGDDPRVQKAFADAVETMSKQGGSFDSAPGDVRKWDGIPLPGCSSGEGCFNVVTALPASGQNGGVDASPANNADGSSFVMAVEMTPQGPRARTVLTYSESVNPASPHYADQTVLFSDKQWVTDRFTEAEINASPELQISYLRR
ncbi:MAG: hypothetical protein HOW97_22835 [Catenulispora sp.]|nr:hypothetical protein [Catenulispora sp.]